MERRRTPIGKLIVKNGKRNNKNYVLNLFLSKKFTIFHKIKKQKIMDKKIILQTLGITKEYVEKIVGQEIDSFELLSAEDGELKLRVIIPKEITLSLTGGKQQPIIQSNPEPYVEPVVFESSLPTNNGNSNMSKLGSFMEKLRTKFGEMVQFNNPGNINIRNLTIDINTKKLIYEDNIFSFDNNLEIFKGLSDPSLDVYQFVEFEMYVAQMSKTNKILQDSVKDRVERDS